MSDHRKPWRGCDETYFANFLRELDTLAEIAHPTDAADDPALDALVRLAKAPLDVEGDDGDDDEEGDGDEQPRRPPPRRPLRAAKRRKGTGRLTVDLVAQRVVDGSDALVASGWQWWLVHEEQAAKRGRERRALAAAALSTDLDTPLPTSVVTPTTRTSTSGTVVTTTVQTVVQPMEST